MKNVKREYKDPYFFFKAGLEANPAKCMRGKKIPQHVLLKPSFYTSLFSFIRLCSFSSSDTTATSSKKKAETQLASAANLPTTATRVRRGSELRGI